jgi:hypothetical protein
VPLLEIVLALLELAWLLPIAFPLAQGIDLVAISFAPVERFAVQVFGFAQAASPGVQASA